MAVTFISFCYVEPFKVSLTAWKKPSSCLSWVASFICMFPRLVSIALLPWNASEWEDKECDLPIGTSILLLYPIDKVYGHSLLSLRQ